MLLKNTMTAGGVKLQNGSRGVITSFWEQQDVLHYLETKRRGLSLYGQKYVVIEEIVCYINNFCL